MKLDTQDKIGLLLKSSWTSLDVQKYYGCAPEKATKIIMQVANRCGTIEYECKSKTRVKTDEVIKLMGGNSRREEIEILSVYERNEQ